MNPKSHGRLVVLGVVITALVLVLLGRMWTMQVMESGHYQTLADANRTRDIVVPPVRGMILDDQGRPLARNTTALVVSADRTTLARQSDGGKAVLTRLAKVLGTTYQQLADQIRLCTVGVSRPCWPGSPYQPIPLTEDAPPKVAIQIMEEQESFPGITAQVQAVRDYPDPEGASAAQLVGYLQPVTQAELDRNKNLKTTGYSGDDLIGRDGLEEEYDAALRGTPGVQTLNVNSSGQVTGPAKDQPAVPGDNLVTSIDARVQATLEKAIAAQVARARKSGKKANQAAGVVMDVRTGRIVALASFPTYNPDIWTGGVSQQDYDALLGNSSGQPLINRAVNGAFPPGSTFKIASLSAAVADGYPINGSYQCPSSMEIGNRSFRNAEGEGFGSMSLKTAISVSCDTVFYKLGYDMWQADGGIHAVQNPKEPMSQMARKFGFGSKTGVDLPSEAAGRIPDRAWKQAYWEETKAGDCKHAKTGYSGVPAATNAYWTAIARENCVDGYTYRAGDAANFAVGQGDVLVTPLQLARAYAAVANGGTLVTPRIGVALVKPDGTVDKTIGTGPTSSLPVAKKTLAYLRSALDEVPTQGTAAVAFRDYDMKKVPIAGKTGTAEVYGQADTALFASYAPANKPEFVTAVVISQAGFGATYAAPVAKAVWNTIFGLGGLQAAMPGGKPPASLPRFRADGTVVPAS